MQYVLICEDKPDSLELRLANREKHLAFIGTQGDRIQLAGPMLRILMRRRWCVNWEGI